MKELIESYLRKRFIALHGEGEPHQADVYRCRDCGGIVTWKSITVGQVCCSGHITPTNPKWYEKFRLLVMPWSF